MNDPYLITYTDDPDHRRIIYQRLITKHLQDSYHPDELPEQYRMHQSVPAYYDNVYQHCSWMIDNQICIRPCVYYTCYCKDHIDIPDFKRTKEPITVCKKRRPYIINHML